MIREPWFPSCRTSSSGPFQSLRVLALLQPPGSGYPPSRETLSTSKDSTISQSPSKDAALSTTLWSSATFRNSFSWATTSSYAIRSPSTPAPTPPSSTTPRSPPSPPGHPAPSPTRHPSLLRPEHPSTYTCKSTPLRAKSFEDPPPVSYVHPPLSIPSWAMKESPLHPPAASAEFSFLMRRTKKFLFPQIAG